VTTKNVSVFMAEAFFKNLFFVSYDKYLLTYEMVVYL